MGDNPKTGKTEPQGVSVNCFGPVSFAWPDKPFGPKKDPNTTGHVRFFVNLIGSPLVVESVIWRTIYPEKGEEVFSVSLPRGINLAEAKSEEQKDALDEWKQEVLMSMDKWEAENIGGKGEQTKRRMAPRLVRKVATVTTAAPTK